MIGASSVPGAYIMPGLLSIMENELPELDVKCDISDSMRVFEKVR